MMERPEKGGLVPTVNAYGETSVPGIFAAGDVSGIEEASSAMIEGRIAGIAAAHHLGFITKDELKEQVEAMEEALMSLRQGMFAPENRGKVLTDTDEGIAISTNLLEKGYVADAEIERYPGVSRSKGIHPVIECTQNIPCNPCQDACKRGCIRIGKQITALPAVDEAVTCTGCGMCVASCSGQAIFLVNEDYEAGYAAVTMPYEFLPLPKVGEVGEAFDRSGKSVCSAEVVTIKSVAAFDKTHLLTIKVPVEMAMKARFFKAEV